MRKALHTPLRDTLAHEIDPVYFDPLGVGRQAAQRATTFPQPRDIAMDAIVTEEGPQWEAQP